MYSKYVAQFDPSNGRPPVQPVSPWFVGVWYLMFTLARFLWRTPHTGGGHACETYVSRLRRKIERDPRLPERIVTVRGRGYKYVPADPVGP